MRIIWVTCGQPPINLRRYINRGLPDIDFVILLFFIYVNNPMSANCKKDIFFRFLLEKASIMYIDIKLPFAIKAVDF